MPQLVRKFSLVRDYVSGDQFLGIYVGISLTSVQAATLHHYLEEGHFSAAKELLTKFTRAQTRDVSDGHGMEISAIVELMLEYLEEQQMEKFRKRQSSPANQSEGGNLVIASGNTDETE